MFPTVTHPLWLLAPLIFIALAYASPNTRTLPGSWTNIIGDPLQAYLGRGVGPSKRSPHLIVMLSLWITLAACLAAITFGHTKTQQIRNLHGRVIVIDMGLGNQSPRQVSLARHLLGDTQGVPTAIIAVTSRAFVVVPFTTDHQHVDRYLQVLQSDVMPVDGRLPWRGIERASQLLADNDILAGQIVLYTDQVPPADALMTTAPVAKNVSTYIAVDAAQQAAWSKYASRIDARLTRPGDSQLLNEDLDSRRQRVVVKNSSIRQRRDLTPWLIAVAMMLWIVLFFRQEDA